MSEDPTEKIRNILIQLMQKKSITTAEMAKKIALDRKTLKRMLGGVEPMSVDVLLKLSEELQLQPEDLKGLEDLGNSNSTAQAKDKGEFLEDNRKNLSNKANFLNRSNIENTNSAGGTLDLWEKNQARALITIGFEQALYFTFLANTEKLQNSGLPEYILQKFSRHVPIQLDPQFHVYNKPDFQSKGLMLTLSFDALYTCFFPWDSISQVVFHPKVAEVEIEKEQDSEKTSSFVEAKKNKNEESVGNGSKDVPPDKNTPSQKSPFAVISNDDFQEDDISEEDVESPPKRPMFTLIEDDE